MSLEKREQPHLPVMLSEVLSFLQGSPLRVFYEGTLGAGGHARAILSAHPEIETYIACDRDPDALELAQKTLHPWKDKVKFVRGNFADLDQHLEQCGVDSVDGFFLTWESRLCS